MEAVENGVINANVALQTTILKHSYYTICGHGYIKNYFFFEKCCKISEFHGHDWNLNYTS